MNDFFLDWLQAGCVRHGSSPEVRPSVSTSPPCSVLSRRCLGPTFHGTFLFQWMITIEAFSMTDTNYSPCDTPSQVHRACQCQARRDCSQVRTRSVKKRKIPSSPVFTACAVSKTVPICRPAQRRFCKISSTSGLMKPRTCEMVRERQCATCEPEYLQCAPCTRRFMQQ